MAESTVPAWPNSSRRSSSLVLKLRLPTKSFFPILCRSWPRGAVSVCKPTHCRRRHRVSRAVESLAAARQRRTPPCLRTHKDSRARNRPQTTPHPNPLESTPMNVIGISAFFHESACCLLQDGRLTAAAEEERFSRVKHDPRLPVDAFRWCLARGGIGIADV